MRVPTTANAIQGSPGQLVQTVRIFSQSRSTSDKIYVIKFVYSDCDKGTYGAKCLSSCACVNNAPCDPVSGECHCQAGFTGKTCSKECDVGFYGSNCTEKCSDVCSRGVDKNVAPKICDPLTGNCACLPGKFGPSLVQTKRILKGQCFILGD